MKKKYLFLILFCVFTIWLGACSKEEDKLVKIAVLGDPENFYFTYDQGIRRAVKDLNQEYEASGYRVECVFYNDEGNYEKGVQLADTLAKDPSISAIIASIDMEINATTARLCEENKKLFIVPYFLYDHVFTNNNYNMVFSMANSGQDVGKILRQAAAETPARRWAVCADNRTFELEEIRGFLAKNDDEIRIVDSVSLAALEYDFDEIYKRWDILGLEGVMLFPKDDEGFEIIKKLKERNPNLILGGDTSFDDSERIFNEPQVFEAMVGFILADEFNFQNEMIEVEHKRYEKMLKDYHGEVEGHIDTWYFQGYNAVRMIGDTAIRNKTKDGVKIAEILHKEGYKGFLGDFIFDKNGSSLNVYNYYSVLGADGKWIKKYIKD